MLSSASDKAKLFAETFSKNSNLDDSGISLPVFPSRTNLKLHKISVTPKKVKKVIMNFDLSKASGPDFISVVVLKNCEPELSYIIAELFNKCLKESCFPDCWNDSSVVPVFKNVGESSTATALLVFFLWLVKSLKNLYIIESLINLRNVAFFLMSSMALGLLDQLQIFLVLFDRIAGALNRSGATRAVALDISKVFDRVWHGGFLHKLKSSGISG